MSQQVNFQRHADWSSRSILLYMKQLTVQQSYWGSCSCSKPTAIRELCWDSCCMCQVFRWQRGWESEGEQRAAQHLINLSLAVCAPEWKVHSRLNSSVVHVLQSSGGCPLKNCLIIYKDGWILYTWGALQLGRKLCFVFNLSNHVPSCPSIRLDLDSHRDLLKRAELVNFLKYMISALIYELM